MSLQSLIGKKCRCIFNLPSHHWPVAGWPAFIKVLDLDMPLIKIVSAHAGRPVWVNANTVERIEEED